MSKEPDSHLPQSLNQCFMMQVPLKQLIANSCHGITSVCIQLPSTAPLESVSLTGCRKLKQVFICANSLNSLAVDDCPQLNSLELLCPRLQTLSASKCAHQAMPQLACPALQQLNLFGCRQLQSEGDSALCSACTVSSWCKVAPKQGFLAAYCLDWRFGCSWNAVLSS